MHLLQSWQDTVSNPVVCIERTGGVAANVAQQLAKTCETRLYTALGDDAAGNKIFKELSANNVVVKSLSQRHRTGIYVAVLQHNGELKAGLADTSGIESVDRKQLLQVNRHLQNQQAVCFDCNCSESLIKEIVITAATANPHKIHGSHSNNTTAHQPLLVALGVSPTKIKKLRAHTAQIDILFANRSELQELADMKSSDTLEKIALAVHDSGVKQVVATDAANDIVIVDQGGVELQPVAPTANETTSAAGSIQDNRTAHSVNGAGDALAGATLAALLQKVPLKIAVRDFGIVAAAEQLAKS